MTRARLAAALTVCLTAAAAGAQEPKPAVTIVPAVTARWDATGHVTWLGERRTDQFFEWDRWFGDLLLSIGQAFGVPNLTTFGEHGTTPVSELSV